MLPILDSSISAHHLLFFISEIFDTYLIIIFVKSHIPFTWWNTVWYQQVKLRPFVQRNNYVFHQLSSYMVHSEYLNGHLLFQHALSVVFSKPLNSGSYDVRLDFNLPPISKYPWKAFEIKCYRYKRTFVIHTLAKYLPQNPLIYKDLWRDVDTIQDTRRISIKSNRSVTFLSREVITHDDRVELIS